jgi:hypothetical protein
VPLRRAIQRLQDKLGMPPFERDKRVVKLTEAGQAMLREASSLLWPRPGPNCRGRHLPRPPLPAPCCAWE